MTIPVKCTSAAPRLRLRCVGTGDGAKAAVALSGRPGLRYGRHCEAPQVAPVFYSALFQRFAALLIMTVRSPARTHIELCN